MATFKINLDTSVNKEKVECLKKDVAYLKATVHADIDLMLIKLYPGDNDVAEFLTSQEVGLTVEEKTALLCAILVNKFHESEVVFDNLLDKLRK